ncbi:MAG: hypothetical protein KJ767_02560, partial [Nanoarchaeota archaeon]|nr:hypothetical protein [Nanoarchaeota archaeon]
VGTGDIVSVVEGSTLDVKVAFTSLVDASDVKIKAEIEGYNVDVNAETAKFDVEKGIRYTKSLTLKVPYELDDELSDGSTLEIKVYNKDDKTELADIALRVQRESYNAEVMSISTTRTAEAGTLFPIDVVLKNKGYNNLDDVYVTARIVELDTERSAYFGDLISLDNDNDDETTDTVEGRIYLEIPENAKSGTYTLEVEVSNDDVTSKRTKQIVVESGFSGNNVFATVTSKNVAVGENAVFSILIVNPTNKLKVYTIVPEASEKLTISADESLVAIPAGTSKTVKVFAKATEEGTYNFNVKVIAGDELINNVALNASVEGKSIGSPMTILTVALAIVFIVLLIVLFVLVGKKPKQEELGESYY